MRSLKHYVNFKYTRHTQKFDGTGHNLMEMGKMIRTLENTLKHVEIQSPKHLIRKSRITDSNGRLIHRSEHVGYQLTWYTRELRNHLYGTKNAVPSNQVEQFEALLAKG